MAYFLWCPRRPLAPKLVAFVLIIFPIFCFFRFVAYFYLHITYGS